MSKLITRRAALVGLAAPAILRPAHAFMRGGLAVQSSGGFSDGDWPSQINRPTTTGTTTKTLNWVGPAGGGANNGNPVAQSRVLTNSGPVTSTAANQIIEGLNAAGSISVQHNGVKVRQNNVAVEGVGITIGPGLTGVVVEDNCITGTGEAGNNTAALQESGASAQSGCIYRRNNGSQYRNGFVLTSNCEVSDNYLHDLLDIFSDGSPPHFQTIEMDGGQNGTTIRHNSLLNTQAAGQTTVIQLNDFFGAFSNITVDNNLIITSCFAFEVTNTFNSSPGCSWSCTNNKTIIAGQATCSAGSISGTTLTVAGNLYTGPMPAPAFPAQPFVDGMSLYAAGIAPFTTIVKQLTGTTGGAGTYQVDTPQTLGTTAIIGWVNDSWFYETSPVIASPFTGNVDFYSGIAIPGP